MALRHRLVHRPSVVMHFSGCEVDRQGDLPPVDRRKSWCLETSAGQVVERPATARLVASFGRRMGAASAGLACRSRWPSARRRPSCAPSMDSRPGHWVCSVWPPAPVLSGAYSSAPMRPPQSKADNSGTSWCKTPGSRGRVPQSRFAREPGGLSHEACGWSTQGRILGDRRVPRTGGPHADPS